jgi:hypothetical protein
MRWKFILAISIAIPVLLLPLALIWYLNLGGIRHALKQQNAKVVQEDE